MVDYVYCVTNFLCFDTPLLYYYVNLTLSVLSGFSSGDTYLSLGISLSFSFVTFYELFCCKVFENFVFLSAILLSIKFIIFCYSSIILISGHQQFLSPSGDIILLAILLTIKSTVVSAVFFNYSFWSSSKGICCRLSRMIRKFRAIYTT